MIYFLHGDPNKTFEKATGMAQALLKKKPDASLFKINQDNFSSDRMLELVGGRGLFSNKYIVTMSRMFDATATADYVMEILNELQASENVFIWVEENVKKPELKKIEKVSEKVQSFEFQKKTAAPKMNIFDLAGALGNRDKKQIWILYQKALREFSPEEIYGTLWWQLKTMLLASKTKTAAEAGMKDFPYKKAKQYLVKYSEYELNLLAKNIINVYHQSRLESEDLTLNLEKFLLTI